MKRAEKKRKQLNFEKTNLLSFSSLKNAKTCLKVPLGQYKSLTTKNNRYHTSSFNQKKNRGHYLKKSK